MLSYIVPHCNRVDLFRQNMLTLAAQTCSTFEIIVIDNSDDIHFEKLLHMLKPFRDAGMQIKVFRIDPSKHPLSHRPSEFGGKYNPALSQNIGVKKASGEIICLTSPEVINASTNCERALNLFSDGCSRFVLGWIDEKSSNDVLPLDAGISVDKIKKICIEPNIHGAMCRSDVPSRPWLPINYFLGFIRKDDFINVGGIDERFMGSIAYEDNFFAHCCHSAGIKAELNESIAGIHLAHSRGYQSSLSNSNMLLWNNLKNTESVANRGFEWGSFAYITGEW